MSSKRTREQSIAVFGESGSGKTVLLSSFYGPTQGPGFPAQNGFRIAADDVGQGVRLYKNYLGMRNSATLPQPTRFAATSSAFTVTPGSDASPGAKTPQPFDALRLIWHDYPGEWFENTTSGPEEERRRIETFRALLESDVAFVLVDAQKLIDNAGEEERYLKSLFSNFRGGLLSLRGQVLDDGAPLVQFPRIWVMALSKADLLPSLDVIGFRELLVEKAGDEMVALGEAVASFAEGATAFSVGEDFVRLSSAKFMPGRIETSERIGVDLVLPLAAILPFERHVEWAQRRLLPMKMARGVLDRAAEASAVAIAVALLAKKLKLPGPIGLVLGAAAALVKPELLDEALHLAGTKLQELHNQALAQRNFLTAMLTGFRIALAEAEQHRVLLKRPV